jgi:hypothetical protein
MVFGGVFIKIQRLTKPYWLTGLLPPRAAPWEKARAASLTQETLPTL